MKSKYFSLVEDILRSKGKEIESFEELNDGRNFCFKIRTKFDDYHVKMKGINSTFKTFDTFRSEIIFYSENIEKASNRFRKLIPELLLIDIKNEVLIMEDLESISQRLNDDWDLTALNIAYSLGKNLAIIHQEKNISKIQISKLNFFPPHRNVSTTGYSHGGPLFHNYLSLIQKDSVLVEAIAEQFENYSYSSFIHGDIKGDNLLFSKKNHELLKFIDWELSGIGDKYFDLGCAIGIFINFWIASTNPKGAAIDFNDYEFEKSKFLIELFLKVYKEYSLGNGKLNHEKIIKYCGIFLINQLFSKSFTQVQYYKKDIMSLQVARNFLIHSNKTADIVFSLNQQ